ncbi:MAG: T9SS type A sorting domain-containing protein [Bacteroidetes bacterium]|nr:T9SS type A sorting domain-containing protein [Bacteroidota bacterium]
MIISTNRTGYFPTQCTKKAVLQFDNLHGETFVLKLMDATGKVVKAYSVEGNQATIERQDLAPGIYIFSLEGQKTQSAGKLVVE